MISILLKYICLLV